MTEFIDPLDPFDPDRPDDLKALLRSLEADEARGSPTKASVRVEVLAAFDAAVAGGDETGASPEPRAEVVELLTYDGPPDVEEREPRGRRIMAWTVAAALLLAVFGAVAALPRTRSQTSADRPTELRLLHDGLTLPADLTPGPQVTTVIGSRLSFIAPEGLVLQEESDGRVSLGASATAIDQGLLVFAELDVGDFEAELQALEDDGRIIVKNLGATVGDRSTRRWDVVVTNDELERTGCEVGQPCVALPGASGGGSTSLVAGADNRITEIGRTDGTIVVLIEQSQAFSGPISRKASEILVTVELTL